MCTYSDLKTLTRCYRRIFAVRHLNVFAETSANKTEAQKASPSCKQTNQHNERKDMEIKHKNEKKIIIIAVAIVKDKQHREQHRRQPASQSAKSKSI